MDINKINYSELNNRQKEIYNFQKVAAILAEYGFNCIKLTDDWGGADFLADHINGDTHKVQLKSRITISKKYKRLEDDIYMTFPIAEDWYYIEHEKLVELVKKHTHWCDSKSWKNDGEYHSEKGNSNLRKALKVKYQLNSNSSLN